MRILGIDPGTARLGWAIIDEKARTLLTLSYGCIETEAGQDPEKRLLILYTKLVQICKTYKPACIALEDLFFATNAKTVIPVGQARGIVLLAAAQANIPVTSYTPLAVKRAITGDGKADKKQVEHMVQITLKLKKIPEPDDAADALAIAMTHAYSYKMKGHV